MPALPVQVPVELDRDAAREAAERELSKPEYQIDQPGLVERGVRWLFEQLAELLDRAAAASPGGYAGLAVALALVVLAVIAVRARVGPLARTSAVEEALLGGRVRTPDEHRRLADAHADDGHWAEAVRERLRATVRDLEDRGLLEPRPGGTAQEAAREAGAALPAHAEELRQAALTFAEIWYGGRPASRAAYQQLVAVDEQVRAARPERTPPVLG